jgi:hypothetical protein
VLPLQVVMFNEDIYLTLHHGRLLGAQNSSSKNYQKCLKKSLKALKKVSYQIGWGKSVALLRSAFKNRSFYR